MPELAYCDVKFSRAKWNVAQFAKAFQFIYGTLYDADEHERPDYRNFVYAFDSFLTEHKKTVAEFNKYRGDIVSSDREAAAFMLALAWFHNPDNV